MTLHTQRKGHKMKFLNKMIIAAAIMVSGTSVVYAACASNPMGQPQSHLKLINVCHEGYAVGYNPATKSPAWVSQDLKRENLDEKNTYRVDNFRPDPSIPIQYSATLKDYARSGYDRGHMAPSEDFRESAQQMDESFFLSNIVPQNPANNRGIWLVAEKNTRYWAKKYQQVLVVTGPIYDNGKTMGFAGKVPVPTHIYKVVYAPGMNEGLAFIVENIPLEKQQLPMSVHSINEVEKRTGITFFPKANPGFKNTIPEDWLVFNK